MKNKTSQNLLIKLRKPLNSPCDVSPCMIWSSKRVWGFLLSRPWIIC
nr:MAG TPA: hypothetical protein [Caudoviricetes sp.]DAV80169.1 MAG TPA: hypothetical protein [Caudoviricetes sp.]